MASPATATAASAGPVASNGIRGVVKQRLIRDMIEGVQGSYKIIVADEPATRILSAAFRVHDLMDHGVTLVDNINNRRQPMPQFPAIYFVSPTEANIQHIINDFKDHKSYASANLFFTTTCPKSFMQKLGAHKNVVGNIKTFVDMQIDFHAVEPLVFTLDMKRDLFNFFGATFSELEVRNVAIRLYNVIKCSGETKCAIRYQQSQAAERVAKTVQEIMRTEVDMARPSGSASFAPIGDTSVPPLLLIVDRSLDMISPLIHELAVQGMLNDLLRTHIKNGIFNFETTQDGKTVIKPTPLDEEDDLWCRNRHQHIVQVLTSAKQIQEQIIREFPAAVKVEKNPRGCTDSELAEATRTLAKYRARKTQITVHIQIAERLTQAYKAQGAELVVPIEQRLATGVDSDNSSVSVSTVWKREVEKILQSTDKMYTDENKVRLALLYAVCSSADKLNEIRDAARGTCSLEETQLQALNIFEPWGKKRQTALRVKSQQPLHQQTARFDPALKNVVSELIRGTLSAVDFPFTDETIAKRIDDAIAAEKKRREEESKKKQSKFGMAFASAATAAGTGGGSKLDLGHGETVALSSSQRIFVFVVGGLTYMERRAMYELTRTLGREVIIGGTSELDPTEFAGNLATLMPAA